MTKTFEELEELVERHEMRIASLFVAADTIPDQVETKIAYLLKSRADAWRVTDLERRVDEISAAIERVERKVSFVARLEAFFGPLIEGKHPPLDGDQLASKAFVDNSLLTFARAIREEFARSAASLRHDYTSLHTSLRATTAEPAKVVNAIRDVFNGDAYDVMNKLRWLVEVEAKRQAEELARRSQPSRLRSLFFALTGRVA